VLIIRQRARNTLEEVQESIVLSESLLPMLKCSLMGGQEQFFPLGCIAEHSLLIPLANPFPDEELSRDSCSSVVKGARQRYHFDR
jgi:hypothetical protein